MSVATAGGQSGPRFAVLAARAQRYLERPATAMRVALALGIVLAFQDHVNRPLSITVMAALALLMLASLRLSVGQLAILVIVLAGVAMRLAYLHVGQSDVLSVTRQAIDVMSAGGNPYSAAYTGTFAGEPFPYGPLELLWYLAWRDPGVLEFALSLGVLLLLAIRGRPVGLVVYALFQQLLLTASDGSNETSAAVFLLVALLVVPRSPFWGAVLLAVASAFKPYAFAWLPGLLAWAPVPTLLGFGLAGVVAWGPVFAIWGVPTFIASVGKADAMHYVEAPFESLAQLVLVVTGKSVSPALFDQLRLILGAITALLAMPFTSNGRRVILAGIVVYLVTLYSGYWSTFGYLAAIAPIVCWHLDEWLGLVAGRIRWPRDPVGRVTQVIDARWPIQPGRPERRGLVGTPGS